MVHLSIDLNQPNEACEKAMTGEKAGILLTAYELLLTTLSTRVLGMPLVAVADSTVKPSLHTTEMRRPPRNAEGQHFWQNG
jgi:hypothetical protein